VDQVQYEYQRVVDYAWISLDSPTPGPGGKPNYPAIESVLADPTLIINLISTSQDPYLRSRQIKIAIESYIRNIESYFNRQRENEFRHILLNRKIRFYVGIDSAAISSIVGINLKMILTDVSPLSLIDDHPYGPMNWRDVDELRATKRNLFFMDYQTAQYFKIPCGFRDEVIPLDAHTDKKGIPF
jgi:hypothetical protein